MTLRHEVSVRCWKNGAKGIAWCRVAINLQFVKNAVSGKCNKAKCNKTRYACNRNKWLESQTAYGGWNSILLHPSWKTLDMCNARPSFLICEMEGNLLHIRSWTALLLTVSSAASSSYSSSLNPAIKRSKFLSQHNLVSLDTLPLDFTQATGYILESSSLARVFFLSSRSVYLTIYTSTQLDTSNLNVPNWAGHALSPSHLW